jgi:glycosyltransferase involved in cell wall biosynthesis
MVKVTYVISNINKAISFEWIAELMDKQKIELSFILLNNGHSELEKYLLNYGFIVKRINYKNKFDLPKSILLSILFFIKHKPQVVHTHLFDANIVGLLSSWICRIKKRVYTRHHSDYHHEYHPRAIKYDKCINYLSTDIVAISKVVKDVLVNLEKVSECKIHLIYHGFKLEDFNNSSKQSIDYLKQKYNPKNNRPVIGVISRQTEWKGIQFIIPAFKFFLKKYPDAILVLANATGDYKLEIGKLLQEIPDCNYIEIEFENDIFSLYQLFDIFTHVPVSKSVEAFGQTYVEALASGIPSVFTFSGIANEFICDHYNALVVPHENSEAIFSSWIELMNNKELRDRLIINGRNDVAKSFQLNQMIFKLEKLYNE